MLFTSHYALPSLRVCSWWHGGLQPERDSLHLFDCEMAWYMQDGTSGGFFFNYCNNVLAHNATIYYAWSQNPWYQATITGISANQQVWNITVSLPSSGPANPQL